MTKFDVFILLLTLLVIFLLGLAVVEAWGGREAPSTRTYRTIRATYGPGYSPFLNWQEDWEWVDVSSYRHYVKEVTRNLKLLERTIAIALTPAVYRAVAAFRDMNKRLADGPE